LHPLRNKDAENLRQRITNPKRDALKLFTYPKVKGMPPTNNHAEQALRSPVIFRKISFGSRSITGAQAMATNFSLLNTAKRHDKDPVILFKNIILKGKHTPLSELYNSACLPTFDSS